MRGPIAAGDTHTISVEVRRGQGAGAGRRGHEAETARSGAVCRAAPARPRQDLPAGWGRGLCSQSAGPPGVPKGESFPGCVLSSAL